MKSLTFLLFLCSSGSYAFICYDKECTATEYNSYVSCVRRSKRHISCAEEDNCESCICTSLHCCHRTCHANCESSSCRNGCRKNCQTDVSEKGSHSFTNKNANMPSFKHNITTVIHLHNIINNTNVIDVPIHINNTNLNNITLPEGNGGSGNGCCYISNPQNCIPNQTTPPYSQCQDNREYHCGPKCYNERKSTPGIYTQSSFGFYAPPISYPQYYNSFNPFVVPGLFGFPGICQSGFLPMMPFVPPISSKHSSYPPLYPSASAFQPVMLPPGFTPHSSFGNAANIVYPPLSGSPETSSTPKSAPSYPSN
ncbi:uncharacterized protein LOC108744475 [Agrilus planipennis]|uniref:Uncharacterized protein LOC108744475 n=1 Tax=Agrilus planipennis TaxID=224129 RepID=A0A1W4XTG5_AGRPL|nr:uncharacterized protein LOC108744475 [Agrilus planipennis]XP_018335764.1 uncharacterized protein LOC108744475 [Agrilus planipennis]